MRVFICVEPRARGAWVVHELAVWDLQLNDSFVHRSELELTARFGSRRRHTTYT